MNPEVQLDGDRSLLPGDVLLFRGHSFLSWAIRRFDGSDVNHAAIVLDATTLVEATGSGLKADPIAPAIDGAVVTVVRRFPSTADLSRVTDVARRYLSSGVAYAYQEILLLALLSLTRRLPTHNPTLRRLARTLLDRGAELLNSLVDDGTRLMTCSEFVYRCYDEAEEGFKLALTDREGYPAASEAWPVPEDERLLDWAVLRPEPAVSVQGGPVAKLGANPEVLAAMAEADIRPMIAAFAISDSPLDPEVASWELPAAVASPVEEVGDADLLRAAAAFRDAFLRSAAPSGPHGAKTSGWAGFAEVVADFVTPGDLLAAEPLRTVARLTPGG